MLEKNCGSGQSLEEIAGRLGCTDRHLRRVFTAAYNVSPVQYLQTCRLLLAKNLLTDTDLSVLEVAMAAGFGSLRRFTLAPVGSDFRQGVWNILCEIPYGKVITYGDIAKKMAAKMNKESMSSQAVGGAVGHNPISIIIPCHRIVGSNGSLTGYAGGVHTKVKLLELEGADMSRLFVPRKGTAI